MLSAWAREDHIITVAIAPGPESSGILIDDRDVVLALRLRRSPACCARRGLRAHHPRAIEKSRMPPMTLNAGTWIPKNRKIAVPVAAKRPSTSAR